MLETGLPHNTTVELLHQATRQLVQENPKRFEQYVKFFEFACMYLNDDVDELYDFVEMSKEFIVEADARSEEERGSVEK